jgi:hypothetical protein
VDHLKAVRERHGVSIGDVERHMGLPRDTYRHIERRRRPLPDLDHGLVAWLRAFLRAVGATTGEEKEALRLASQALLQQFSHWLDDLNDRLERQDDANHIDDEEYE